MPIIRKLPLVVDLDGTLTTTDTLMESVIRAIQRKPGTLLRMPLWLAGGRASFKAKVAEHADFQAASGSARSTSAPMRVASRYDVACRA